MKIVCEFPRLFSKPKYGLYLVTAIRSDGTTHTKGYTAISPTEAERRYLVEFGKVCGEIQINFSKPLDNCPNLCYNEYNKSRRSPP